MSRTGRSRAATRSISDPFRPFWTRVDHCGPTLTSADQCRHVQTNAVSPRWTHFVWCLALVLFVALVECSGPRCGVGARTGMSRAATRSPLLPQVVRGSTFALKRSTLDFDFRLGGQTRRPPLHPFRCGLRGMRGAPRKRKKLIARARGRHRGREREVPAASGNTIPCRMTGVPSHSHVLLPPDRPPLHPFLFSLIHLAVELWANFKSISSTCTLVDMAFAWELTKKPFIGPWVASRAAWLSSRPGETRLRVC